MTKFKFILIATILFTFRAINTYGQGCSDAGFCTLNSFKPNNTDSVKAANNQIKIGAFFGKADNSISVYGNYLEYNRQLNKIIGLDPPAIASWSGFITATRLGWPLPEARKAAST